MFCTLPWWIELGDRGLGGRDERGRVERGCHWSDLIRGVKVSREWFFPAIDDRVGGKSGSLEKSSGLEKRFEPR